MSGWTAPKDIILYLAGYLTVSGGTNCIIEYFGPGAATISATGKGTHLQHGRGTGRHVIHLPLRRVHGPLPEGHQTGANWPNWPNSTATCCPPTPRFTRIRRNITTRWLRSTCRSWSPTWWGPTLPTGARPISRMVQELREDSGLVDEISSALIGSCTNSSYEDMSRSADVAEQAKAHGLAAAVPFMVTPGSEQVRATIERDGQMQSLRDINAAVLANACGPLHRSVAAGGATR